MRRRILTSSPALTLAAVVLIASGCAEEADTTLLTAATEPSTTTTDATTTTEPPPTTSTTEEGAATTTTTDAPDAPDAPPQDVYAVGETAHTGVFDVTVHQVVSPWESGNQFEVPRPGHHFVAVEASLVNVDGDELEVWSSFLGAEVSDSLGRPWDTAFAGYELPTLDGDVGLGMTRRGWVVFEVADDATGLLLRIAGNVTATGSLFALGV